MSKTTKFFFAGLLGAVAGAVGGLLFAPQAGKETRKDIKDVADKISKEIKFDLATTEKRVRDIFGNTGEKAMAKYKMARKEVVKTVLALKKAGKKIDVAAYGKTVEKVVSDLSTDLHISPESVMKLVDHLKSDWEKIKSAIIVEVKPKKAVKKTSKA